MKTIGRPKATLVLSADEREGLVRLTQRSRVNRNLKLSLDPQLIAKIRGIVGLYMNPPANAAVFAVDEKSQIQALERAQPILPMDIGQPERRTHNYLRHGTVDLFAALDVVKGTVIARRKRQHRSVDFVAFLREIDESVPSELDVHVIVDNLSAHKSPRFKLHFTPTYASWLNLVERFFGLLTDEALKRGSHTSVPQLRAAITAYVDAHNEEPKPFKWTKTADQILDKMRRFGLRTQLLTAAFFRESRIQETVKKPLSARAWRRIRVLCFLATGTRFVGRRSRWEVTREKSLWWESDIWLAD